MKKTFVLISSLLLSFCAFGQEKVKEPVSDQYDRNGLATILVTYRDSYDQRVAGVFNAIDKGDKFDINEIEYTTLTAGYNRGAEAPVKAASINNAVNSVDLGKAVIGFLYDRKPSGVMSADRVISRGHYNATEADLLKAESSKLGKVALGDRGFDLIANNYILVVDYSSISRSTENNGDVNWNVKADGYLYKINFNDEINRAIFDCWIYEDDSREQIAEKMRMYEALEIGVKHVTTVSTSQSYSEQEGGLDAAIGAAYGKLIYQLEKGNDDWLVKAAIYQTKPVKAKIGTKEGLRNGMRFDAYRYYEDRAGNLRSSRRGIVRATKIANNKKVAERDSPASEFYQIAGMSLEPGMVLRQKNDLGMGISAGYRVGGMSGVNLQIDYLIDIKTSGMSQYAMIDASANFYQPKKYFEKNGLSSPHTATPPSAITAIDVAVGYGAGFRATRHFEIVPHIMVGFSYLINEDDLDDDSTNSEKLFGYTATAGVKFNINISYPFQLFAGANYTLSLGMGNGYTYNNEYLKVMDKERTGLGIYGGVRYTF